MTKQELIERYPFLRVRNVWTGELSEQNSHITELDFIPEGWRKAFGLKMMEEIRNVLLRYDFMEGFYFLDIKEKHGTLQVTYGPTPDIVADEVQKILDKYEEISYNTCIECGEPTLHHSEGYIVPLCIKCKAAKEGMNGI